MESVKKIKREQKSAWVLTGKDWEAWKEKKDVWNPIRAFAIYDDESEAQLVIQDVSDQDQGLILSSGWWANVRLTEVKPEMIFLEPEQDIEEMSIDELVLEFKSTTAMHLDENKRLSKIKERIQEVKKQLEEIV